MNEHLKIVFNQILPTITDSGILYWVYGGVGYATFAGEFYRGNKDVDLFVLEEDFESVQKIIEDFSALNNGKVCISFLPSGRPKIDVFINGKETLSVMPVYKTDTGIVFKSHEGEKTYPLEVLAQEKRILGTYEFFTPKDEFIKSLFIDYLESKKGKYPDKKKRVEDAKRLLTAEEFKKYFL